MKSLNHTIKKSAIGDDFDLIIRNIPHKLAMDIANNANTIQWWSQLDDSMEGGCPECGAELDDHGRCLAQCQKRGLQCIQG